MLGVVPAAVLYAAAGAMGRAGSYGLLAFGVVLAVAAVLWVVGRRFPVRLEVAAGTGTVGHPELGGVPDSRV